jgi:hypothetical protein
MSFFNWGGAPKSSTTGGTTPPPEEAEVKVDAQYELGADRPDVAVDSRLGVLTPGDLDEEKRIIKEDPESWRQKP